MYDAAHHALRAARVRAFAVALLSLLLAGCAPPVRGPLSPTEPDANAGDDEVTRGHAFVDGAGGVRIYHQWWKPRGTARAQLVIHHGLKSHSEHYAEFAAGLAARGYAVDALDMRGHGRSGGERATLEDFDDLTADLRTIIDRARAREGELPLFVAGHSVGGAVVTKLAIDTDLTLDGLILLAPALRVDRFPIEAAATPTTALLLPNLGVVDVPNELFSRNPDRVRAMDEDPLIYQPAGPARTADALLEAWGEMWPHMESLDMPLLGLHGTADLATDPRGTAEAIERASSSDKTLLLYEGLVHDLLHEPEAKQVADDIEAWLDERAAAADVSTSE